MPWKREDPLPLAHSRDELLADVLRRGRARRRRGRQLLGCGLALVAVLGAGLVAATAGDTGGRAEVAAGGSSASTVATTTPATTVESPIPYTTLGPANPGPSMTTGPSTTVTPPTTRPVTTTPTTPVTGRSTTTLPACWMSTDPACGEFRWEPDPGPNEPLRIEIVPTVGADGRTVDLAVTVSDPDGSVEEPCRSVVWGDGEVTSHPCMAVTCLARFGVWPTPPRQPDSRSYTEGHMYAAPGAYEITVRENFSLSRCFDPYASWGEQTVTVVIPE